jgi:exopolyphosphatase/guanosine-5'-triphosphate,3'-diphosphate pyrophosphatase
LRTLATVRLLDRARLLGAATRVGYAISAAMPDVLPRTKLTCTRAKLTLHIPSDLAPLANDRLAGRLKALAKIIGRESEIKIGG